MRLSDSPLFDEIYRSAHSVWFAAESFAHGVGIAGDASVPSGAAIGVTVGRLMASSSEMVLSLLGGPFTLTDEGDLKLNGPTGAQGSTLIARVKAERAAPFISITQDLEIDVVAAQIVLPPLPITDLSVAFATPTGSLLAELGSLLEGETRTIVPNDGRVAFKGGQTALIVGTTAWSAGDTDYVVFRHHPNATNSPLGTAWRLTVQPAILVPVALTSPQITGSLFAGETLTGVNGTYSNEPTAFSWRWFRNSEPIVGETSQTYVTKTEDVEAVIQFGVTPSNSFGTGEEVLSEGVEIVAAQPLILPWYNTVFRATTAGSGLWEGGTIPDPNDAENETATIIGGLPLYPAPIKAGSELQHGRTGSAVSGASLDVSPTLAGNEPLLGGTQAWSSAAGYGYVREIAPGNYSLRIALGQAAGSGRREALILMDGLHENLQPTLGAPPTQLGLWSPATAYIVSKLVVGSDLGIWRCTTAGTSGSIKPSGEGPTFTDGTAVWTRTGRSALLVVDAVTPGPTTVVDQNSSVVALDHWKDSPPAPINISGDFGNAICLLKPDGLTPYIRTLGLKSAGDPLAALTLTDDMGVAEGATPVVYARQPEGYRAMRLVATSGNQEPSNYSLSGDLAPYFKLINHRGRTYLAHNATSIPDSAAGPGRSLTVTQTSGGFSRSTTFQCEVVSSAGKPLTGQLSKITTQNWLNRKRVKDVLATDLWPGYQGEPFASDQLCVDGADFIQKFLAIIPDGVSWYRLRIGNGRYDGRFSGTVQKDFGMGGVLIERDAAVTRQQARWNIHGLYCVVGMHIRDLHIVADKTDLTAYMIRFDDPGPTGVLGGGRFNTCKIDNCIVGPLFIDGNTPQNSLGKGSFFLSMLHGKSVEVTDCDVWGTNTCYGFTGVRAMNFERNSYRCIPADIHGLSNAANPDSTQGVFPDDHVYVNIADSSAWAEPDYSGYTSDAHADWVQIRTFFQNLTDWYPNAGPNGATAVGKGWKVGDKCLSTDSVPAGIYEVVSVTGATPHTGATPPMGTGASIPDGDLVWKYVRPYTTASDIYMNIENCYTHSACPIANGPARQWFIDSNGGNGGVAPNFGAHNCGLHLSANFNLCASLSSYGITSRSPGTIHAEYNSFVGPADIQAGVGIPSAQIRNERGNTRSRFNYVRNASTGIKLAVDGEKVVVWTSLAAAPSRPSDLFVGPVSVNLDGKYTYPTFNEDLYATHAAFSAAFKAVMGSKDPAIGVA